MPRIGVLLKEFLPSQILFLLVCVVAFGIRAGWSMMRDGISLFAALPSWNYLSWIIVMVWGSVTFAALYRAFYVARGRLPETTGAMWWQRLKVFIRTQLVLVPVLVVIGLGMSLAINGFYFAGLGNGMAQIGFWSYGPFIWAAITLIHGMDLQNGTSSRDGGAYQSVDDDDDRRHRDNADEWRYHVPLSQGGHMPDLPDIHTPDSSSSIND